MIANHMVRYYLDSDNRANWMVGGVPAFGIGANWMVGGVPAFGIGANWMVGSVPAFGIGTDGQVSRTPSHIAAESYIWLHQKQDGMAYSKRYGLLGALFSTAVLVFSGCETFTDLGLKNATWQLYDIRTPQADYNLMTLRMQDYRENDPAYRYHIHFYEDDRCTGTYYAADTLNYEVEGTWSLPQHDILRISLDGVVNGDFLITKLERHIFFLTTEENYHGLPIEPPYFPMDMSIQRLPG